MINSSQIIPVGVKKFPLRPRKDERGCFTEFFRDDWAAGMGAVQWNMVNSTTGVLRGFHVHLSHFDYLIVPHGTLVLGLKDMRKNSPTFMQGCLLTLKGDSPVGYVIPPGVGHGFYFPEPTFHIYAVSEFWNKDDELGCLWNDPELALDWPVLDPILSERDQNAPSFPKLLDIVTRWEIESDVSAFMRAEA